LEPLKKIREAVGKCLAANGILTGVGLSLRSCDCQILNLEFQVLTRESLEDHQIELEEILSRETPFPWDIFYATGLPGTDLVRRLTLRRFCSHCRENYLLERRIGTNSIVLTERL